LSNLQVKIGNNFIKHGGMNMKIWKTLIAVLLAGVMVVTIVGCSSKKSNTSTSTQQYIVKKGDISNTITAAGNLALSQTQDVVLDLFYPSGTKATIGSVLVGTGDSVKKDQVLVTLDKDEWNDQLSTLQQSLSTAQRNVTTKNTLLTDAQRQLATLQRAVSTAQENVTKAQRTVTSKQLALTQSQLAAQSANYTLYQINQVASAKATLDKATDALNFINNVIDGTYSGAIQITDIGSWQQLQGIVTSQKAQALVDLNAVLSGTGTSLTTDVNILISQKVLAVAQANLAAGDAQIALSDAQDAVNSAQQAVDDASYTVSKQQITITNANQDLNDAKSTLADTQKKLTDAQAKSPEIKAPFDGFVTKINVSGGDQVPNGTVAVTVADPNKFEADILVSEMDIMKVSLGGAATMTLNAISGLTLPAKVTEIAPTATISSGVVNYTVKVEIDSQAVSRLQAAASATASSNSTGQSPASANTTGQGSAPPRQTPSGGFPSGGTAPSGRGSSQSQIPSSAMQNIQLKQGLTGTVSLIISQATNVLLVPNTAITKAGNQNTVQVMTANNTIEKRAIQTGLADWQNTVVTSGLSEGDKIVINKTVAVAPTTSSSQQRAPGGILFGR
jgi:membrane fusion protein, macrolide-specific efflux system